MRYDTVMFDLDGTLLDTLADLTAAGNYALTAVGRPTYSLDDYRTLVGQGVRQLFVDALGPDHQDLLEESITQFKRYYADHRFDTTAPYAGIDAMLDDLSTAGAKLAVLSNKPHEATVDVVGRYFPLVRWSAIRGYKDGTPPKPEPDSAREVLATVGYPPQRWVYVGDTKVDMLTGKAAGMYTVGVAWGFRSVQELRDNGADAIIQTPAQLVDLVLGDA